MEKNQIEDLAYTIHDTKLYVMQGLDTVGEIYLSKQDSFKLAAAISESGYRMERISTWVCDGNSSHIVCNACGGECLADTKYHQVILSNFCPYCGADMRGDQIC